MFCCVIKKTEIRIAVNENGYGIKDLHSIMAHAAE